MTGDPAYDAMSELAETLVTGTPPGKPPTPPIPIYVTGVVSSVGATTAVVAFAHDPALPADNLTIPFTLPVPTPGDVVLVLQLPHQRIIVGVYP